MGHRFFVVGLIPQQYIYCELRNAYSGVRAQNLVRQCQGRRYYSLAVDRLKNAMHPDDSTNLATQPRRLTRMDVGSDIWCNRVLVDDTVNGCDNTLWGQFEPADSTERAARVSLTPYTQ